MFLPWRQHQVTGITQGIDERVDFGGQSSARLADRLRAVFFSRTGAVLMSTHDGGVDHHVLVVVIAGQQLENTVENPALRPSAETLMDRFPMAETLGQIPPGTSSPKAVENRFDEQSIIFGGAAHVSFTPRQNVLDPLPLVVAQSKTLHRPAPPRADHP